MLSLDLAELAERKEEKAKKTKTKPRFKLAVLVA
jgi:hypothetical protein